MLQTYDRKTFRLSLALCFLFSSFLLAIEPPLQDLLTEISSFVECEAEVKDEVVIDPMTGIRLDLRGGVASKDNSMEKSEAGSWHFSMRNRPVDTSVAEWMGNLTEKEIPAGSLFQIRYKCSGLCYTRNAYPVITLGNRPLLLSSECYNDAKQHSLVGVLDETLTPQALKVHLRCDGEHAELELFSVQILPSIKELECRFPVNEAMPEGLEAVKIQGGKQTIEASIAELLKMRGKLYDVERLMPGMQKIGGLFFSIDKDTGIDWGRAIASPADLNKIEEESGLPWRGHGQAFDDRISLPLSGKAAELWLVLAGRMVAFAKTGATPVRPPDIGAHEVFSAEIRYADGTVDYAFPYSIADKGFSIRRFLGAYALALNPEKELKEVIFHNYSRPNLAKAGLVAATLNRSCPRVIPDDILNPPVKKLNVVSAPAMEIPLEVTVGEGRFSLENSWYRLEGVTEPGFAITALSQKIAGKQPLLIAPSSFELALNGRELTGMDFHVAEVKRLQKGLEFRLVPLKETAEALEIQISITGGTDGEIVFNGSMKNIGETRIGPRMRFPVLQNVKLGNDYEENWLYFPKYYSIHTNESENYCFCPGDERAYFVQFYDCYNPLAGYGLELMTHNLQGKVLDYGLFKTASGIKYFIQYPAPWYMMNSGESKSFSETSLILHQGDWHNAFELYKKWCGTWHRTVNGAGLEWWRNSWILRNEFFNKQYDWVHPIYLEDKGEFRMDAICRLASRRWAGMPEIMHFWGWNVPPLYPGEEPRRGTPRANYADGEFDPKNYIGGPERLRNLVRELQANGSRVSFYAIPAYLPKACPIGKSRGMEITQVLPNGQPLIDPQCYFPCAWCWADTFVAACRRAWDAVGFDALYIDISPFPREYSCYSAKHGHPTPLNMNETSREIFRKMREALPEGVAILHEDPACDVDTQWSSGCMTYYHVTGSENRAPNYAEHMTAAQLLPPRQSILRFAFPKYKMLAIPVGLTSGNMEMRFYHAPFFNGEGLVDNTTGCYNDRTILVMRHAHEILKANSECFNSDGISPLVPTEAYGIYANYFPAPDGNKRLWTLYNGRFYSYRGAVLKVKHEEGAVYRDLWNNREIIPVPAEDGYVILHAELPPQMVGCISCEINSNAQKQE